MQRLLYAYRKIPTTHEMSNNYTLLEVLGSGSYGEVFLAENGRDHCHVAVKRIPSGKGLETSTLREIGALLKLKDQKNIIALKEVILEPTKGYYYLVLELMPLTLKTYLSDFPSCCYPAEQTVQNFARQIITGVDFCHTNGIIHRDLKPANILISRDGEVKIADFGLARRYDQGKTLSPEVFTLWYRAPEILLGANYGRQADLWAVGCIFAEIATKRVLFAGDSQISQLREIFRVLGNPTEATWRNFILRSNSLFPGITFNGNSKKLLAKELCVNFLYYDLIDDILKCDPHLRLTASGCLDHDFFSCEFSTDRPMHVSG